MTNNIYFIANWKMYGSTSSLNSLNKLINLSKKKSIEMLKLYIFHLLPLFRVLLINLKIQKFM